MKRLMIKTQTLKYCFNFILMISISHYYIVLYFCNRQILSFLAQSLHFLHNISIPYYVHSLVGVFFSFSPLCSTSHCLAVNRRMYNSWKKLEILGDDQNSWPLSLNCDPHATDYLNLHQQYTWSRLLLDMRQEVTYYYED